MVDVEGILLIGRESIIGVLRFKGLLFCWVECVVLELYIVDLGMGRRW